MRRMRVLVVLTVVLCSTALLRADDYVLSLVLRGGYTTSSKIFFNSDVPFDELRQHYFELDGITGWGAEIRYQFPGESFFVTFSVEYFSRVLEQEKIIGFARPPHSFPTIDGLTLTPYELGVYTYIPLGTETARLSMGGGVGVYVGERILRVAGVEAEMRNSPVNVGIHISSGFEYRVYPRILLRGDMKFRDPELKTLNRYTQESTTYDGIDLVFPRSDIAGRINIDGFTFSLGVVVELY